MYVNSIFGLFPRNAAAIMLKAKERKITLAYQCDQKTTKTQAGKLVFKIKCKVLMPSSAAFK